MIPLLLLCACAGAGENKAETLALTIRDSLEAAESITSEVSLRADYGQRVYEYELSVSRTEEETLLTLTSPETVAGISARLGEDSAALEYEGLTLETGDLDDRGLSPMSAVPALLDAAREGYLTSCSLEEGGSLLRTDCADPEAEPGTGREITLWYDTESQALTAGEIRVDGYLTVRCEFREFALHSSTENQKTVE